MSRSRSAHQPLGTGAAPTIEHRANRMGSRARIVLAVTALVVAGTLANAAIQGSSESMPGAIELGRVPAAAVSSGRTGLHLVGARSVELLGRPGAAGDTASGVFGSGSTIPGRDRKGTRGPSATTSGSAGSPSTSTGSGTPLVTAPTLPGVTVPTPPAALLPPRTLPPETSPTITLPQATLPSISVPVPSIPTTVALPGVPRLPILDFGQPGNG